MGGLNSGSRPRSGRLTDDHLHRLSIGELRRAIGVEHFARKVRELRTFEVGLAVRTDDDSYSVRFVRGDGASTVSYGLAEAQSLESPWAFVGLVETAPNYGGTRYWFCCPRLNCGRRCSVLYRERESNARAFACRRCTRFRYATQILGGADLIVRRIEKLVVRCQLRTDGSLGRRKGMHHRTFQRLSEELDEQIAHWRVTSPIARKLDRGLADLEREIAARQRSPLGAVKARVPTCRATNTSR